ncbi:MAG: CHAD domain-containing protein [Acidobacteria bacterium]|nr:CHAD domain-containing protein [Acidobacteriota bacterium]
MSISSPLTPAAKPAPLVGLALWMHRVLEECDRASVGFAADPVHDLRVALRRCRSLADGFIALDPDPAWKAMKKAGRQLFRSLGELRDVQVAEEWVHKLDPEGDPAGTRLLQFLAGREIQLKTQAAQSLQGFDRKQWLRWSRVLPKRAARIRPGSLLFRHLALERWAHAYDLHRRALRNRSQVALHDLRIGIKRFRYIVENFLPEQHAAWKSDLKHLQDLLGEVHDLDVLWATAVQANVFLEEESRAQWQAKIKEQRERRIAQYRERMLGPQSRWAAWRAHLPQGEQIEAGAQRRLTLWASLLDPDFAHTRHVRQLALQLYDGLPQPEGRESSRRILALAALLHNVGLARKEKGHHKISHRLLRRLIPPMGWSKEELDLVAIVARYHQGALPQPRHPALQGLTAEEKREVLRLAGILRLADAFASGRSIQRLQLHVEPKTIVIAAQGYSPHRRDAEAIAAGRHLLEVVYRRPIVVRPLRSKK